MIYFEYEQLEEVLEYIKNYPEIPSDSEMYKILKEFRLQNIEVKPVKSRKSYRFSPYDFDCRGRIFISETTGYGPIVPPFICASGSPKEQYELIQGILLSVKYNFGLRKNIPSLVRSSLRYDIENNTYKGGETLNSLEKLRLEAAYALKKADKFLPKANYIEKLGSYIYEGLEKLAENKVIKEAAAESLFRSIAGRMINDGISLTVITKCLKADPLKVYCLAKSLNRPFNLSPEEEELIKNQKNNEEI